MNQPVRIAFLGDCFLGGRPEQFHLDESLARMLGQVDLVVVNQEGPLTDLTHPTQDKCSLVSSPGAAAVLRSWNVGVATLANNHMFDYGWDGFAQTRSALTRQGIQIVGAGRDLAEASQPLILTLGGQRVALLAYSWAFVQTTCATESTFGCAPLDAELMVAQVSRLARAVDHVIVLPHWGYCDYRLPTPEQRVLARRVADAGARAIIGNHSHVVQGLDWRGGRLIAYSLGNFVFAAFDDRGTPAAVRADNVKAGVVVIELAT
ncbi:MAG: CapA family protein, partial [Phycisphaerae bacterium]|nr:CapA family protein [Phycisphaerae bacterium]